MTKRNSWFLFISLTIGIIYLSASTGCAVQEPPTGGPRDTLPPVLVSVRPADSAKNFSAKKITLEFNEFVQLDNYRSNLIVSPTPKTMPEVEGRLRTVTITIKDTLKPNTTYAFDFGKAIKDVNEGNVFKNFSYVFTTGDYIDSLTLSGKVIMAQTGQTDSSMIAVLYSNLDDSAVTKERPLYVTRLNKLGEFTFRFLPAGTYALYALKDESGTQRYLSNNQLFSFYGEPIHVGADSSRAITLYAYQEEVKEEKKIAATVTRPSGRKPPAKQDNVLRITSNLDNGQLDLLGNLEIGFPQAPLKTYDSTKWQFTDENFKPLTGFTANLDTTRSKLIIAYKWTENTPYNIILNNDFASDTAGRTLLKNDTLVFRSKKTSDYGQVRLRFAQLSLDNHPVLQFVQNNTVKYSHVFSSREFLAALFQPGEYELRILYDENQNGKWDAGEFFGKHRQPEHVIPISRKITVKANWENEADITF